MFTQPTPPSERAIDNEGKRVHTPDHSQSAHARKALPGKTVGKSSKGGSGEGMGAHDAEPVCRHTTVPVSAHASHSGSQCLLCTDGSPICAGNSGKRKAGNAREALVRTSAPATSGSCSADGRRPSKRSGGSIR